MRILKPEGIPFTFDDKDRRLLFTIDAIDAIQEKYNEYIVDIINSLIDIENKDAQRRAYNRTAYILYVLWNQDVEIHNEEHPEDKWQYISEEYIRKRILNNTNVGMAILAIINAFNEGMPKSEDDDDPNLKSGQQKS